MSVILISYNALNSHHVNGISSNLHRNPNALMYSLEIYCSLLVFSLHVQQKVHIRESSLYSFLIYVTLLILNACRQTVL